MWQALEQLAKYNVQNAAGDSFNEGRHLRSLHPLTNLAELTVPLLQNIEKQLKSDLQIVTQVCYRFYLVCLNEAFVTSRMLQYNCWSADYMSQYLWWAVLSGEGAVAPNLPLSPEMWRETLFDELSASLKIIDLSNRKPIYTTSY